MHPSSGAERGDVFRDPHGAAGDGSSLQDLSTRKQAGRLGKDEEKFFKKLVKVLGYLSADPRHNSLSSHEISDLTHDHDALRCLTSPKLMTTLTIRLPDALKGDLDKLSRRENKPVSDMVRESLRRYVAVEKFRAVRKKILPFAEAQGLLSDEDVFKALS